MSRDFKDFYEGYWEHRKQIGKIHTKKGYYIPERLKAVVSLMPADGRKIKVLDMGCGEGTLGMLLKEKFKDLYAVGCDISENTVELARPFYDKTAQVDLDNDSLEQRVGNERFDYIVCVEILEHLMHPDRALKKLKGLLSKDGRMIVSFPNIAWWKYRLTLLKGHFPEESRLYHHAEHLHDFTMHTFMKLLKDSGLESLEIGGEFIPPKFMQKYLPKGMVNGFMRKYPNLFGYQVVIKTKAV
ncbi:MAG: methyltransferase domain-containing protein [Thermodesulfobacteriota bacterium]|nr:MAG: methyltransferase domain-containing protein [Thermodesulfobacteriota bacterium]